MLEQAVNGANSIEDAKLAAYLRKSEMRTIVGPISFGKDGEWAQRARGAGAVPRHRRQGHGAVPQPASRS
jgi:hypothetical protein